VYEGDKSQRIQMHNSLIYILNISMYINAKWKEVVENTSLAHKSIQDFIAKDLIPINLIRLGLVLNFFVFARMSF
jgi:hypothetical protein